MNTQLRNRITFFVYLISLISIVCGSLGILGWVYNNEALKTLNTGKIAIEFNTSLALLFLGLAIGCAQREKHSKALRRFFAAVPTLIGAMTWLQYLMGWDLQIDQYMFLDHTSQSMGLSTPGRMALNTTIALFCLGLGLLFIDFETKKSKRPSQYLACISGLLSLPAIIIYFYKIPFIQGIAPYTQMAIYTAISVSTASVGILLLRADKGFMAFLFGQSITGVLLRSLLPSAVLVPITWGIVTLAGARAGYYGVEFALTLSVIMCIIVWISLLVASSNEILVIEENSKRLEIEKKNLHEQRDSQMLLFRTVLETIPSGVVVVEAPSRKILFANPSMKKIWQDPFIDEAQNELTHKWIAYHANGKTYEAGDWPLDRTLAQGESVVGEDTQIQRHDSKRATIRFSSVPLRNSEGKISAAVVVCEDVSELKQAEALRIRLLAEQQSTSAIRDSETRLRAIFDSSFEAIISNDADSTITEWNPQAEKIFLYTRQEAIGQKIYDLIIPPQMRESHIRATQSFFETGHGPLLDKTIEIQAMRKGGDVFPIQLSVSVIRKDGHFTFTSFIDDITERKKNERDLIAAKQEALEALKVKSEFLANMSHEIRTPINAVIGLTDLLKESPLTPEQSKFIQLVQESGSHLLTVINDILDFSKIEAGQMKLEHINFNVKHLIQNTSEILKYKIQEKKLAFKIEIDPQVPLEIKGDPGRIGQILLNLLSNALKFTESGSITVKLSLENSPLFNPKLRFSIIDTGIGLSPESKRRLFTPFVQADGSTARKYGGTGLGLSICKRLVALMNGEIQVESTLGQGSNFSFTGVFVASHQTHARLTPRDESGVKYFPSASAENFKILVAEDNSTNQLLTLAQLKSLGYAAQAVANGAEAIAAFKTQSFDLILMDCQMPEMDGFEATQQIRELEKRLGSHIPIIALTANAMQEDEQLCLNAGMDAYLSKPTKRNLLAKLIDQQLSKAKEEGKNAA